MCLFADVHRRAADIYSAFGTAIPSFPAANRCCWDSVNCPSARGDGCRLNGPIKNPKVTVIRHSAHFTVMAKTKVLVIFSCCWAKFTPHQIISGYSFLLSSSFYWVFAIFCVSYCSGFLSPGKAHFYFSHRDADTGISNISLPLFLDGQCTGDGGTGECVRNTP